MLLATLTRDGRTGSEAVRAALVEVAERRRRSRLVAEVARLAAGLRDAAERPRGLGRRGRRGARLAGVTRGDLYSIRLPHTRPDDQRGPRFAVIVQADGLLGLPTVLLAPTSRRAVPATFRSEVQVQGVATRVLSSSRERPTWSASARMRAG